MKKKYRDIIVDDEKYAWQVVSDNDDGGSVIKIWKNKKVIIDLYCQYYMPITPKVIEMLINLPDDKSRLILLDGVDIGINLKD